MSVLFIIGPTCALILRMGRVRAAHFVGVQGFVMLSVKCQTFDERLYHAFVIRPYGSVQLFYVD